MNHHKIDVFKIQQKLVKEEGKITGGCTLISELCFTPFPSQKFKLVTKLLHEHFNTF